MISGVLAGLARRIATINSFGVGPSFLYWLKSGEVIVMTILGGMGTLYGPMIGAGVYLGLKEILIILAETFTGTLSTFFEQWQGILGVIFILFVIYVPEGLVSLPAVVARRFNSPSSDVTPDTSDETSDREVSD